MATIFGGCHVVLDLTTSVSFKKKQEIRKKITDNDGIVSYIVTKKSTHVVCNDPAKADISYKCKMAQKYRIPVVSAAFLYDCVEKGRLLSSDDYLVIGKTRSQKLGSGKIAATKYQILGKRKRSSFYPAGVKAWPLQEKHTPIFNSTKYQVAKYAVLQKYVKSAGRTFFCVLEVHVTEEHDLLPGQIHRFRVSKHHGNLKHIQEGKPEKMECYYVETSEEATKMYSFLYKQQTDSPNLMEVSHDAPPRGIGTLNFQKMMMAFGLEKAELSAPVCELVEGIWREAYSDLSEILTSPSTVKLEQIEKAEALLMKLRGDPEDKQSVLNEFYSTLPHNKKVAITSVNNAWLSTEQDLCQVMKDMLTVSESTGWSLRGSTESKYRALRCQIEHKAPDHHVYKTVKALINKSLDGNTRLNITNIFEVQRQLEEDNFTKDISNQTLLFHASKPNNFVGILSRGLLMPKMVVDEYGGKRTDAGMLGAGIYFASAASTSVKYSQVSKSRGTRMMLVNKVALGKCMDLYKHDQTLDRAPNGYSSVHGVASTSNKPSDFTEDEYVVYSADQQKMCYLVEFTVGSEKPIPMEVVPEQDSIDTNTDRTATDKINLKDVKDVLDPMSKVKSGLIADGKDVNPVELTGVNVCGKLMDLVAEVKVFQQYHNNSDEMLEGKYVFPLDEMAAVCGFEAYINDKHVVGEVKEKETAHKEYKKAISEGHGAYLMDQDEEAPDVFTVSVGNVPPRADVIIKITYVTELQLEGDLVSFRLPGNLAPWKESSQDNKDNLACCVCVAVDMPFDLKNIYSPTHKIVIMEFDDDGQPRKLPKAKPTGSKAMMMIEPGQTLGDGFQLLLELTEAHVPRMWVEQDEDNPTNQACMLTFYPEFEACEDSQAEVILMLDLSNSMTDEGLNEAKKVLLLILHHLPSSWTFNVVIFGTTFRELFPSSQPKNKSNVVAAEALIQSVDANMGNTDLYRPLHSFYLLKPESVSRNIFLVSDGHINHQNVTMDTVHKNSQHTRVFTFGVSNVMNRHLLGALARVGAGAFEGFDSKAKSKWEGKVKSQVAKAGQPGLTSVAVSWQQEDGAPPPKQAPNQITALFSGSRMVVYGFVQNCTSATLSAEVGDQEIAALVTKSDRYVTKGKILHRLAAKAIIRDWEDGLLSSDGLNQQKMKMDLKDYVIKLSKQFCIVTQLTSFIAVEKREKDEKLTSSPDFDDLLEIEYQDVCSFLGPDIDLQDMWDVMSDSDTSGDEILASGSSSGEEECMPRNEFKNDYVEMTAGNVTLECVRADIEEQNTYEDFAGNVRLGCLIADIEEQDTYEDFCMDDDCYAVEISEAISADTSELDVYDDMDMEEAYCDLFSDSLPPTKEKEQSESRIRQSMGQSFRAAVSEEESDDEMAEKAEMLYDNNGLFDDCSPVSRVLQEEVYCCLSAPFETAEAAPSFLPPAMALNSAGLPSPPPRPTKSAGPPSPAARHTKSAGPPSPPPRFTKSAKPPSPPPRPTKSAKPPSPPPCPTKSAKLPSPSPLPTRSARPPSPHARRNRSAGLPSLPPGPSILAGRVSHRSSERSARLSPLAQNAMYDTASKSAGSPPPPPIPTRSALPLPDKPAEANHQAPKKFAMSLKSAELPSPSLFNGKRGGHPPVHQHVIKGIEAPGSPPPLRKTDRSSYELLSNQSTTAFKSAGPPPPPPQSYMAFKSAGPPPPPPQSYMAFKSAGPPPPPPQSVMAFQKAVPAPPPPQSAIAFKSAGPPPPPPQSVMAFQSAVPAPPPPPSAMAFPSAVPAPPPPPSAMPFQSAGPPPPPTQSAMAFAPPPLDLSIKSQKMQQRLISQPQESDMQALEQEVKTLSAPKLLAKKKKRLTGLEKSDDLPTAGYRSFFRMSGKPALNQTKEKQAEIMADNSYACEVQRRPMAKMRSPQMFGKQSSEKRVDVVMSSAPLAMKSDRSIPEMARSRSVSWRRCEMPESNQAKKETESLKKCSEKLKMQFLDQMERDDSLDRIPMNDDVVMRSALLVSERSRSKPQPLKKMLLRQSTQPKRSGCMGSSSETFDRMSRGRTSGLHVDGDWVPDRGSADEQEAFLGVTCHHQAIKQFDLLDTGTKMPQILKTAKKNLTKTELDTLKRLQNKDGGWSRDDVEKALFIDLTACIEALNKAGLKSLGLKVAMEMESVLVTAFVLIWILKSLVPELFPLDTSTKSWSVNVMVKLKGPLEVFDLDRSIPEKALAYCDQREKSHPGVSSILELGPNWFNVASKILGF